jgi:N-methylhydantoinase A
MLETERVNGPDMSFQRFLDLRYEGQEFSIKVPVSTDEIAGGALQTIRERFDAIHNRSFGHAAPDEPLEMVNIRLSARGVRQKLKMPSVASDRGPPEPRTIRKVCLENADDFLDCPVYARDTLSAGAEIEGPALIEEYGSTTVLFSGDRARVSDTGEMIIQLRAVQ